MKGTKFFKCCCLGLFLFMFVLSSGAAFAAAPFHIGIATLTVSQAEDTYRGAEHMMKLYGDAEKGGYIKHVTMPDNFMAEMETTITQIVGLADDPKMKVIVVDDAVPGTTEAFRRIKEKRKDILCFAGNPQEDPNVINSVSDMSVLLDIVNRGYLLVDSAKKLGAKTFVHVSFPRHMSIEVMARRRAIIEQACKDLGLKFVFQSSADPTSDVGVPGAQQFILEKMPAWIKQYGKDAAFYTTNQAQTEPMLVQIAKYGGIFIEPELPSPLQGYPGAFNVNLKKEAGNWPAINKKVEEAVVKAGGKGRMGSGAYSFSWTSVCALVEYGKNIVEGKTKPGNAKALQNAYGKFTPGAKWSVEPYVDISTGVRAKNLMMVFQDTYIYGKGYLNTPGVKVPGKYAKVK